MDADDLKMAAWTTEAILYLESDWCAGVGRCWHCTQTVVVNRQQMEAGKSVLCELCTENSLARGYAVKSEFLARGVEQPWKGEVSP